MKRNSFLPFGLLLGSLCLTIAGAAEERVRTAPRAPPPAFQAHPRGVQPKGPAVVQHPVRVLAPRVADRGQHAWSHWQHTDFARPSYYWDWQHIHSIMCVTEDSYGDQYPITEAAAPGFGLSDMTQVEDDALDRCYAESGQDTSCILVTCTHI